MKPITHGDRDFDELIDHKAESVHIERMGDDQIWVRIVRTSGEWWELSIYTEGKPIGMRIVRGDSF